MRFEVGYRVIRMINQARRKTRTQVAMICWAAERLGPNHLIKNVFNVSLNMLRYLAHFSPRENQEKSGECAADVCEVGYVIARETAQTQQYI